MSNNLPLYGRKWLITLYSADGSQTWTIGDQAFSDSALHCTFNIQKVGYNTPWYGDISIWNLYGDTMANIWDEIKEGMRVTVEAGYLNGQYGKIFDGLVFQPLFDRQNVTDFVTTLHCMDGLNLLSSNFISTSIAAGYDYISFLKHIASNAMTTIPIGDISANLGTNKTARGQVLFGEPKDYFRKIADDNIAQGYVSNGAFSMAQMNAATVGNPLVVTPPQTTPGDAVIIGTPQQIAHGVNFTTLLCPLFQVQAPPMTVKLDMTVIRQMKIQLGQLVTPLDKTLTYKVAMVTHRGDTRGNDWYTDITGLNLDYLLNSGANIN